MIGVLDHALALLIGRLDRGLELRELAFVEPATLALGAAIDLDPLMALDQELGLVSRTVHAAASVSG